MSDQTASTEPAVALKTWIAVAGAMLGAFMAVLDIQRKGQQIGRRRGTVVRSRHRHGAQRFGVTREAGDPEPSRVGQRERVLGRDAGARVVGESSRVRSGSRAPRGACR